MLIKISFLQDPGKRLAKPQFGLRWKMFELDGCAGNGRVCLVFPLKPDPPPLDDSGVIRIDLTPATPQVNYPKLRCFQYFMQILQPHHCAGVVPRQGLRLALSRAQLHHLLQDDARPLGLAAVAGALHAVRTDALGKGE